jgi:WD40 repeat protein/tRNA A-37 threonylcarbamoyl transferase component Bud32
MDKLPGAPYLFVILLPIMAEPTDFPTEAIAPPTKGPGSTNDNGTSHIEADATLALPGDRADAPSAQRPADTHQIEATQAFPSARPGNLSDATQALPASRPGISQSDATMAIDASSPVLSSDASGTIPKRIKNYDILGVLGRGGMGVVYKARQHGLNRMAALKMILAAGHASNEDFIRFQTEAEAVAKLQHPNIVQIFEVGEDNGHPFFSLEYVDGGTLAGKLANNPLPARQAAELVEPLAQAMDYAHQNGILHRDLKPGNVLITQQGSPKITDFGLAKRMGDDSSNNTGTGSILGTPAYMAPEQAEGKIRELGPGADIYALGSILYHALTGRPPFVGETVLDTLQQVKNDDPVPPSRLQPKVPRDLETICLKCLQKEPRKRYESARLLADDLRRFLDNEPIQARPIGLIERGMKWARRRPQVAALLGTLFFVIVGGFLGMATLWLRAESLRKTAEDNEQMAIKNEGAAKEAEGRATAAYEKSKRTLYAAEMNLAQDASAEATVNRLRDLLESQAPHLVGFEWKYLTGLLKSETLPLKGHTKLVRAVAFRPPDGKQLASASGDGSIVLWDPEARASSKFRQLTGHAGVVRSLTFNPTGKLLASAGEEGTIQVFDLNAGGKEPIKTFGGDRHAINSLAFSPRSEWLISGGDDGALRIWPLGSDAAPTVLKGHEYPIADVAVSNDGTRIASASLDKTLRVWDAATHQPIFSGKHDHWVTAVAFSADGKLAASASWDKIVKVWDGAGNLEYTLAGFHQPIRNLAFSPDNRRLAASCHDNSVLVWDLDTKKVLREWPGEPGKVRTVAFSSDGQLLASVNFDLGKEEGRALQAASTPLAIAFGGRDTLAAAGADGELSVWEVAKEPAQSSRYVGRGGALRALVSASKGEWISGAESGAIDLWKPPLTDSVQLGKMQRWALALGLDKSGKSLAAGSADGVIDLFDVNAGKRTRTIKAHADAVRGLAYRDDGKCLASGGNDRKAYVWNPATGEKLFTLDHSAPVLAVAFQPGEKLLATAGADRIIRLWDSESGHLIRDLRGHTHAVTCLTFSPDGRRLVSGSDDATVKLWDPTTGQETLTLRGHTQGITGVAFNGDASRLASSSWDHTIRLWETPAE